MHGTAPIIRRAGSGTAHNILGMTHVYKATPAETNDAFLLFEMTVPPGLGAPPHSHHVDSEFFYVLDGALNVSGADGSHEIKAGDSCFLPVNGAHSFRNDGAVPARVLVVTTPGRDAEQLFGAIDGGVRSGNVTPESIADLATRHGLTIVPPGA